MSAGFSEMFFSDMRDVEGGRPALIGDGFACDTLVIYINDDGCTTGYTYEDCYCIDTDY